jgi:hypothetical protein
MRRVRLRGSSDRCLHSNADCRHCIYLCDRMKRHRADTGTRSRTLDLPRFTVGDTFTFRDSANHHCNVRMKDLVTRAINGQYYVVSRDREEMDVPCDEVEKWMRAAI